MRFSSIFLLVVALAVGCASTTNGTATQRTPARTGPDRPGTAASVDPACDVESFTRASGLEVWSPDGEQYVVNKKDAAGIYQLYVGSRGNSSPACITCTERVNAPSVKRHKLQAHWHPSGKWILLAAERDKYKTPPIHTKDMIEGWILSGLFTNIYATRPDGSQWQRLSDFGGTQKADGFVGVLFTPDGKQGVWAQIIDGNVFKYLFGKWELIVADVREDANGMPSFSNPRNITPSGANWIEPGNFAPDGKSLLITADIGMSGPQGQDQFILDITTGSVRNLNNTPEIWDEHGIFSPDGEKIFFMSSLPFKDERWRHNFLFLKTELMMMNKDGSGLQQLSHFNTPGYPESNPQGKSSVAAGGEWHPNGRSIAVLNLMLPALDSWTLTFKGPCGSRGRRGSAK